MLKCQIDVYSHFFKVSKPHPGMYPIMRKAKEELTEVKWAKIRGRFQKQEGKTYATRDREGYRFHINYLPRFKELMQSCYINYESDEEVKWVRHGLYQPDKIDVDVVDGFDMYDYQEDAHEYIISDGSSKLVTLSMGQGKSKIAVEVGKTLGVRMLIMVLGKYKEKWVEDIKKSYGNDVNVYLVKSLADLTRLIDLGVANKPLPDIIIVTLTVMQNYISEWEENGVYTDMVPPEDIYRVLKVGYRLIDEAHQHYHAVFKSDLYTHCPKTLYLTATLDTNDRFQTFVYQLMWPLSMRNKSIPPPKYDETYALLYTHLNPNKIRWKSQQGYSHVMYEQSIWKHVPSRCQYLDLIGDQVENWFVPIYEKGKKMLIFCALVDTCIAVVDYLKYRFKDKGWEIGKYTAGDPKSIIDNSDITVSTLGRAGTGLDIPGLVVCLMTNSLSEPKANKQAKGRLRDLSKKSGFEHIVPKFLYFVAEDLQKPLQYHREKKALFAPLTLKHVEQRIGTDIGRPMREYLNYGKSAYWEGWKAQEGQVSNPKQEYTKQYTKPAKTYKQPWRPWMRR